MYTDEGDWEEVTEEDLKRLEHAASSGDFADACEELVPRLIREIRYLWERADEHPDADWERDP